MNKEHIYKVSFKEPPRINDTRVDFFFTSLAAIYDTFSRDDIGCKVTRLWCLKITPERPYFGKRCTITQEKVRRKARRQKK